jgi:integral membrane protein (TIGR00529 family)
MLNLVGVIIAFIVIIFLIRKKFNFGFSLIIGSLIVGVFSLWEIEPIEIPKAMIEASFYSFKNGQIMTYTIELAILMIFIFILAKLMQETGAITKLINSLRTIFSKGGILGVIPAVYGLMPVPGGALFSVPMVNEEGDKYQINNNQKNFLNVWFRHIWFPIYPISSAMILICSDKFSDINIYLIVLINIPAFIASIMIGIFYLKKFIKNSPKQETVSKKDYSGLIYLLPPVLPLAFYGFLQFFDVPNIQIRSFIIGVFFSIILLYFITKTTIYDYIGIVKKSVAWKLALAIFGIMIFREIFSISGAPDIIANVIGDMPFPTILVIIAVPFVLGLLTGYNLGAVALSYPLVEPFFQTSGISIIGITSIIFVSSLAGYLISPIHLCNVLSSDYLKTDTTRMYRMYIPAVLALLIIQTFFITLLFSK